MKKSRADSESSWSRGWRIAVSVLLLLHLTAVVIAPLSDPPPASDLSRWVAARFRPYLQLMSLNNGYRFFAPDPGPSHLVRYELTMRDGSVREGRFPDLSEQWPRLLYHRHFMLAEMLNQLARPELPPGEARPDFMPPPHDPIAASQQAAADALGRSLARQLLVQTPDATSVRLFLQEHAIPTPLDLQSGLKLNDKRLYQERFFATYPRDRL
jgi:hypothetical protein